MSAIALHLPARATFRSLTGLVLATIVAMAGLLTGGAGSATAATTSEQAFTAALNAERVARGLPALAVRADLVDAARAQSARMGSSNTLYHNPDLTSDVTNWRWVGENVGYGPDATVVHAALMASPAHRANILDTDYTEIGIGTVTVDGRIWVTQVFRRPQQVDTGAALSTTAERSTVTATTLSKSSRGTAVERVQRRLEIPVTGYYGTRTTKAVTRFQQQQGWAGSGKVNTRTWRRLF